MSPLSPGRETALILLAEDDTETRDVWKAVLEIREGYQVLEAADGADAVEIARRELPDAILMDLLMPNCNGIDAVRLLKSETATQQIPIIALSDYVWHEKLAREALDVGCIACLEKRGDINKVSDLLKFVLSQSQQTATPQAE